MRARINRVAGAPIFAVARTDNLPPQFYESLRSSRQFKIWRAAYRALLWQDAPTAI